MSDKSFLKNKDTNKPFLSTGSLGPAVCFSTRAFSSPMVQMLCVTRDTADEQALASLGNAPQCPQFPPSNSGTHLGFQFISKVGVIEVHKAKKQGTFLRNVVIFGNLFLHILFQERHVAEKTTGEGPEQLEQQFYIAVIPSAGSSESTDEVSAHFRTRQDL